MSSHTIATCDCEKCVALRDDERKSRAIRDAFAASTKETIATDPTTGGQKARKLAVFSLLPWDALWALAEHFGRNCAKYEDRNWERGYKWSWSIDAIHRHLALFVQGTDYGTDEKTGRFAHIVAVAWHAVVLTAFWLRGVGTDDRPKNATIKENV